MTFGIVVKIGTGALFLYGIPFILIAGWLSSRLLGVRRGWLRSAFAGLCGWVFGLVIAAIVSNQSVRTDAELNDVLALAFFFGILVTMFVSLALELLLRPKVRRRRHWLRPILHPITTIKRRLAPLGRSREIVRYARKRGLAGLRSASMAKLATPEYARRIRLTLEDCGGMFVKFGQIASTRSDLLPEALTTELAQLQSSARPVPAVQVRDVLEAELHATVEEEFASVRLRAVGRRVDRPDPPRRAQVRRTGGGQDPATRHRRRGPPGRRRAAPGRRHARTARGRRPPARDQAARQRAHQLARA